MTLGDARTAYRVSEGEVVKLDEQAAAGTDLAQDYTEEGAKALHGLFAKQIRRTQRILYMQKGRRFLLVLQAMDAGGKDGVIRRAFSKVDPQGLKVWSFKKPSEEELARDFLWRVHQHVPCDGEIGIFNRSHYEDIVAVRAKKLFPEEVWRRRYRHIVEFERMLAEEGTKIVKIFLHVSKAEQKRRLEERLSLPEKNWKFHPNDLEDRDLWDEFRVAHEEALSMTSRPWAPWYVVPSDVKWYRNLCAAKILAECMADMELEMPSSEWDESLIKIDD